MLHATTGNRYADGDDIRLVNLGPIALINSHKLAISSGTDLDENSRAHIVSLMYEIITSAKGTDDLSVGFDCEPGRR